MSNDNDNEPTANDLDKINEMLEATEEPETPELSSETVEDRSRLDSVARRAGQLPCKHSSIAGAKNPDPQKRCERFAVEVCKQCNQPYCPDHASVIDIHYCADCLSPQTVEVTKEPLVGEDGVHHNGTHILIPQSSAVTYKSLATMISEMTDEQLTTFIREERVKVRQTEAARDYHRIALSSSELEQEERAHIAARKLRGVRLPASVANANISTGTNGNSAKKAKATSGLNALAALLKAQGLEATPENITKLAAFLASKKG